jgi:hypothetical protein
MIDEYVLVPDIFDPAAYSNPAFIEMCLPHLKEPLLQEALVRDLCDGGWSAFCLENAGSMHRLCKEILKKLRSSNRLRRFPQQNASAPASALEWCQEALAGHGIAPLTGIIAAHGTNQQCVSAQVASIERLTGTPWWQARSCSLLLERKTDAFLGALSRILQCANSLMFIDPNLDPASPNYGEFHELLVPAATRRPMPQIELHRSFCLGDGPARTFPKEEEWRRRFGQLSDNLQSVELSAEVFLWLDFHARYLVTDLVGLVAEAGFDVTRAQEMTTWARLGRNDRDSIQRQFAPETRPADLKYRFTIGARKTE